MSEQHDEFDFEFQSEFESDWPHEVPYDPSKHASNNAHRFLAARPAPIIVSDDVIYSLDFRDVWLAVSEAQMMAEIRRTDPGIDLDVRKIRSMVAEVKINCRTTARPFQWIKAPENAPDASDLILCGNGLLDLRSMTLIPMTENYFATSIPEWDYNPVAKCPLWMHALSQWLHPSFHPTLQEFTGYLLSPDTSLHAMLCLLGETRGGKGTVGRIQTALVGAAHCAFPAFNDLAGDFGLEGLDDKRLISVPDAHDTHASKRGTAIERLKSIAAGDPITINRKGTKQQLNVKLPAKIVLTANQHPNLLDESGALAAREIPIMFENSFNGAARDINLTTKLLGELPGIANWAIEGLRRLRQNGGQFTIGAKGRAALEDLEVSQSIALRFAAACLEITGDSNDIIPLAVAYAAYENWASDIEGLNPRQRRDKTAFRKDMVASLQKRGVAWADNQVRWHKPGGPKRGIGERVKHRFVGVRLKANAGLSPAFG
ncbi:DNA primase family protein [Tardiphaga sp. 804_B3_N1_9]|uniref:DNA primase family protein n=1 Tax=Tardiphaga sp. 804_B3_N1_9 TaxID=3240786 RepID=UPI003F289B15